MNIPTGDCKWSWRGLDRATGKITTYYTKGVPTTIDELQAHVAVHYPGLEFIDGHETDGPPPGPLTPVKRQLFQSGCDRPSQRINGAHPPPGQVLVSVRGTSPPHAPQERVRWQSPE